jgi:dihydrofolate reductase
VTVAGACSRPASGPEVRLVAALARNRVIGRDNELPWRLPEDLRRFRALTMGHPVLMGRRTHESIGRALPGRENLVLTRRPRYRAAAGCRVLVSLEEALQVAGDGVLMVIGGAELYAQTLPLATVLHLTLVDAEIPGDTLFPVFDAEEWETTLEAVYPAGPERVLGFRFVDYQRRRAGA